LLNNLPIDLSSINDYNGLNILNKLHGAINEGSQGFYINSLRELWKISLKIQDFPEKRSGKGEQMT